MSYSGEQITLLHMALVPMVIKQPHVVSALLISILVYLRNASFF